MTAETRELIINLAPGETLVVQVENSSAAPVSFPVTLIEFEERNTYMIFGISYAKLIVLVTIVSGAFVAVLEALGTSVVPGG